MTCGLLLTALALTPALRARAAETPPFLDSLFSDNMVLQRGEADPIWGWATPGTTVTVIASGNGVTKTAKAVAGTDGKWLARIPALPVGGPYTIAVSGPNGESETRSNVLVGDVWLCSGQSNMEFGVGNLADPAKETADADYPEIRLLKIDKKIALDPQATATGSWEVCTPENLRSDGDWGGFSAVGYFFGRDLYQDLHVPIGLIHSSWGGTPAQAWTSEVTLGKKVPDYVPQLKTLDAEREALKRGDGQSLDQRVAAWYAQNDPGVAARWADQSLDDSGWGTITVPGFWEQAGIADFANFDGIAWFRKDVDIPADAASKDLVLHLVADDDDTTWVNGTQVGATAGYNVARAYRIPAGSLKAGHNIITVRVLDTGGDGGIYGPENGPYLEVPGGANISLAGSWRYKIAAPFSKLPPKPQAIQTNQNYPTVLFNGMINPLVPYRIKGAIWYQGESNAWQAYQYRSLLPAMIGDWRGYWKEGDFPFLIVQLAGFGAPPAQPGDDSWAELREAQWLTAKNVPNAGIATAIDIGNSGDIHPKNKEEVGRRLALVARAQVYHEKVDASGPVYRSMKVEGNAIRIRFDHVDGGLMTNDGGPLKGFAIAGADKHWVWADAKIDGDTVVVSSPDVPNPVAVRYGWAPYLDLNFYNKDGLPAFPFRTDDWPEITRNNH